MTELPSKLTDSKGTNDRQTDQTTTVFLAVHAYQGIIRNKSATNTGQRELGR